MQKTIDIIEASPEDFKVPEIYRKRENEIVKHKMDILKLETLLIRSPSPKGNRAKTQRKK